MMDHALKWEMDLYMFIRAIFNAKLEKYNIKPHDMKLTKQY